MSFLIRSWARRDVQDVLRLVKELAASHNALHQVEITPEALQADGFAENAIFGYLVAEVPPEQKSKEGHTIIGYHFHYLTYCTWDGPILFGKDLYVVPEFRGRGIGTALLNRVAKIALEKGCSQFRFISTEWNQRATDFYSKKGAMNVTTSNAWHVWHIERDHVRKLAEKARQSLP